MLASVHRDENTGKALRVGCLVVNGDAEAARVHGDAIPICFAGTVRQVLQVHVTAHDRHMPRPHLSQLPRPCHPIGRHVFVLSNTDFKSNHCSLLPALACVSKLSERQICSNKWLTLETVSKLANAASRPRQLKLAPTLSQQVVGIGFSRCVREAQVFLAFETPWRAKRFR